MKKLSIALLTVFLLGLLIVGSTQVFGATSPGSASPTLVLSQSVVPLDAKSQIVIMGSGYEPGQEVTLLAHLSGGRAPWATVSDIGVYLDPSPVVANEFGVWATAWTISRFSRLAGTGVYLLEVVDEEYNILASAPFGFVNMKEPQEEWPAWGQVLLGQ
ncbi:hypothetical protein ACFLYR_05480 [Chloroflexota bacterium]